VNIRLDQRDALLVDLSPPSSPLAIVGPQSTVTSHYADSLMSQSSDNDASKDAASKKNCGSSNNDEKNGSSISNESKEKMKSQAFNKRIHHEQALSWMVKHPIVQKDQARFKRMLSVNVVVPFLQFSSGTFIEKEG
jgi:hypothetical protein